MKGKIQFLDNIVKKSKEEYLEEKKIQIPKFQI